ncbi:porin family protein [Pedobacter frigoris]|uniref:porin family protein n=1 Tax=Pedobacter frigoris TaxID=2571272 RepID=UPI00292DB692|nr:porin family protein [Pedobacter frigoris]
MKRTLIGLLLIFITGNLFAQESVLSQYGFRLGLTAHPTIGWVKPQIGKSNGVSLGFAYGLLGDFNFAENYSFATGITINTINGKTTEVRTTPAVGVGGTPGQIAYDLKYQLQYIEVPLTVKLKTTKIGDVRWYGQFGLSNDFKIGAKQDADANGNMEYRDQDVSKSIKFYRAGLIIGAGGEFDISGNTSLFGGLTYNNGFTDITDDKDNNVRNHYIGINFGVFF